MRRKTRDFGRLKLIAFFVLVAVLLPKFINARSTDELGAFSAGETGIKLCARINKGSEDALRFSVTSDQGFTSDVIVAKDTCKTIETQAANYTIREYLPQEYILDGVTGGTVNADATSFVATAEGQYTVIYENSFYSKPYLHNFGYTGSSTTATAVGVHFDANGGTGSMDMQLFGLNAQQNLSANTFTRDGYNYTGWNTAADGSGDGYTDGQAMTFASAGEITLYAQWEEEPAGPSIADNIADQANEPTQIDFARKAVVSSVAATANGNGINKYTENGQDVYYYRGEIANNNVIWGGQCWKILRTTSTGGVKLIYNGERKTTAAEGSDNPQYINECSETGQEEYPSDLTYKKFNTGLYDSPAGEGYMYGDNLRIKYLPDSVLSNEANVKMSKNIIVENGEYYLDTSEGQSTLGMLNESNLAAGYRYFCLNASSACGENGIGYFVNGSPYDVMYFDITGYNSIEDALAAAHANINDSNAKATIESWFETAGLAEHEDDLEDVIFCNDRNYNFGSWTMTYAPLERNTELNEQNNYTPSLDCANKNDSFTKEESATGNGKLNHKVGMITADELTLAGVNVNDEASENFLYDTRGSWAMSPFYMELYPFGSMWRTKINELKHNTDYSWNLRPVVSLKSTKKFVDGGNGTLANPYIVK